MLLIRSWGELLSMSTNLKNIELGYSEGGVESFEGACVYVFYFCF